MVMRSFLVWWKRLVLRSASKNLNSGLAAALITLSVAGCALSDDSRKSEKSRV